MSKLPASGRRRAVSSGCLCCYGGCCCLEHESLHCLEKSFRQLSQVMQLVNDLLTVVGDMILLQELRRASRRGPFLAP